MGGSDRLGYVHVAVGQAGRGGNAAAERARAGCWAGPAVPGHCQTWLRDPGTPTLCSDVSDA